MNVLSSNRKNNTQGGRDPTIQNTSIVLICNAANGFTLYSLVAFYYLPVHSQAYCSGGLWSLAILPSLWVVGYLFHLKIRLHQTQSRKVQNIQILWKCGASETLQGRGDYEKEEDIVHCRNKILKENNRKILCMGDHLTSGWVQIVAPFCKFWYFVQFFLLLDNNNHHHQHYHHHQ